MLSHKGYNIRNGFLVYCFWFIAEVLIDGLLQSENQYFKDKATCTYR